MAGKKLGGQKVDGRDGAKRARISADSVYMFADQTKEPEIAAYKATRQRGMRQIEIDALETESVGVTQYDPSGKPCLKGKALADALLDREHGDATTGYHVDKDGHYLTVMGEDGKPAYAVDVIQKPTDKSTLADVGERYLKAIEDDPRYQEALKRIEEMFRSYRDEPWGELSSETPPAVQSAEPRKDAGDRFTDYYGDFYSKLTGLHLQGGYDKQYDSLGPVLDKRDEVRKDLAAENPEMDTAMANKSRHWLNVQDQLMKSGCDFNDCTFMGPDGKALEKLPANATEEQYQRYTDALVYAMDHGMISSVTGKDGKEISGLPVQDAYTANLSYYDEHAANIEKYRAKLEAKTAEACGKDAEAHKGDKSYPEIAGCKITGVTNEQYYADAKEKADNYQKEYDSRVKDYEAGKNPMLSTLKHFGMDVSGVNQPQAQPGPAAPNSQRVIQEALNRADAVNNKAPEPAMAAEMGG